MLNELTTTVACVRGMTPSALLTDPRKLYVGRRGRHGWKGSRWSNPFRDDGGAVEVQYDRVDPDWFHRTFTAAAIRGKRPVDFYSPWLDTQPRLLAAIPELVGFELCCWCGSWAPGEPDMPCHAVVLAKRANAWAEAEIASAIHLMIGSRASDWFEARDSGGKGMDLPPYLGMTPGQHSAWLDCCELPEGYRPPGWPGDRAAIESARMMGVA